ncbi:MAG: recombinase family protein [Bacteroidales bacterium]|nr:recombinase family protein [Bacteroidales bacterium]
MNYVYIRFSTDKQDERQQMNVIEKHLSERGLSIDRIEVDEGVSGGKSYRNRKLYDLIKEMKSGDCLIVSEVSRLGRTMVDLSKMIHDELKPRGVRLICINLGIDLDCSNLKTIDEMILNNFAFAAQLERELICERTMNALEARKKAGIRVGGTKENWGKNTGTDRKKVIAKATKIAADSRTVSAKDNQGNKAFRDFMEDWVAINGPIGWNTNWMAITDKLNSRGLLTSRGLPFTPTRARSMYTKIKKLYAS